MSQSIIVVGVGGVGMAHVCAAGRSGWTVRAIVEADPVTLARAKLAWKNAFDGMSETVPVQPGCRYAQKIQHLADEPSPDLVVIATPPHTHERLALLAGCTWTDAAILVEKPFWLSRESVHEIGEARVRTSGEYAFLTGLQNALKDADEILVTNTRPNRTTEWGYQLTMAQDYLPHIGAILVRHLGCPPLEEIFWTERKSELFRFTGTLQFGDRRFHITALRGEEYPYQWRIGHWTFQWELELFDRQLGTPEHGLAWPGIKVVNALLDPRNVREPRP
jgi:hypothetical protein